MSDKPGHILEIPESLGRDVDRAREGKIPPPPIEAFLSDEALAAAEKATRAAEPVHAEDLRPISKAEAARRTAFDGERLPALPAVRRVIPAPFRRDRITIDHHGKTWQYVRAGQVREGDIIPDLGLVSDVRERLVRETVAGAEGVAVRAEYVVTGSGGVVRCLPPDAMVRVFRA